jgi:LAS superfamily LD-carboxypeptidase LdcB
MKEVLNVIDWMHEDSLDTIDDEQEDPCVFPEWVNNTTSPKEQTSRESGEYISRREAIEKGIWLVGAAIIYSLFGQKRLFEDKESLAKRTPENIYSPTDIVGIEKTSEVVDVITPMNPNVFKESGNTIKERLKLRAKNGESGRLKNDQLEIIGEEWGNLRLHPDAAASFRLLSQAFGEEYGKPLEVESAYRTYKEQEKTKEWWRKKGNPDMAATPGKSNHGWGLAVDFGDQDPTTKRRGLRFNQREYDWLEANMPKYGWETPSWADNNSGIEEPWHKEYVGVPYRSLR